MPTLRPDNPSECAKQAILTIVVYIAEVLILHDALRGVEWQNLHVHGSPYCRHGLHLARVLAPE